MKPKLLILGLCVAGIFATACNKDEEGVNPMVQNNQTNSEFVGVADDGTFDKLSLRGANPEAMREFSESLGINLDDIDPNTIVITTYSVENYNRHYSLTMNLREFAGKSYFVLKQNKGIPVTMDVMRVPYGSEWGGIITDIFSSKAEFYKTKDADKFGKWVTDMAEQGFYVVTTYDEETGVYSGTALTEEEWKNLTNPQSKVKYYDRTK